MSPTTKSLVVVRPVEVLDPDTLTLPEIEVALSTERELQRELGRKYLVSVLTTGALLAQAKQHLKHGEYLPWLRKQGISPEQARKYRFMHRHLGPHQKEIASNLQFASIGIEKAFRATKRVVENARGKTFTLESWTLSAAREEHKQREAALVKSEERVNRLERVTRPDLPALLESAEELQTTMQCPQCGHRMPRP